MLTFFSSFLLFTALSNSRNTGMSPCHSCSRVHDDNKLCQWGRRGDRGFKHHGELIKIQNNLDKGEKQSEIRKMNFYKGKYRDGKIKCTAIKQGIIVAKKQFCRKDWEVTADCNLLQEKTGIGLGCIDNRWNNREGKEVNCLFSLLGPQLEKHVQFWVICLEKEVSKLGRQ